MFRPAFVTLLYQCYGMFWCSGQVAIEPPTEEYKPVTAPNLMEMWMKEVDKHNQDYNPNPGYEPYWPQGAWVFEDDDMKKYGSTTKMKLVCGEECNYLFKKVKRVCGKKLKALYTDGCSPNSWLFKTCDGAYPDALLGFYNFDTFCDFLNHQCNPSYDYYWVFVHVGHCLYQKDVFKPVNKNHHMFSRLKRYFSTLEEVFYNASLPSPQGITRQEDTSSAPKYL